MSSIPHKEERFMFVVYPHIAFSGAFTFNIIIQKFSNMFSNPSKVKIGFVLLFTFLVLAFSVSRSYNLYQNYNAPKQIYDYLDETEFFRSCQIGNEQTHVCIGKEWYRFHSHYFFPSDHINLTFIRQGPQSQLPQYYPTYAHEISPNFNDQNKEEPSRYTNLEACHYVIDCDADRERLNNFPPSQWDTILKIPFLDAANSPILTRAFYVPTYSEKQNSWTSYFLLKRKPSLT